MPYHPGADIRGAILIGFAVLSFAIGFAATRNDTHSAAASYSQRGGEDGAPSSLRGGVSGGAVRLASDCTGAAR